MRQGAVEPAAPWIFLEQLRWGGKLTVGRDFMYELPTVFEMFVHKHMKS